MVRYGDSMLKLKNNKNEDSAKIYKTEKKRVPTMVAFNGSGFDFNFIMKKFLNDKECTQRFKINCIYKGSNIVLLAVYDILSGEIVLRSHDMC